MERIEAGKGAYWMYAAAAAFIRSLTVYGCDSQTISTDEG